VLGRHVIHCVNTRFYRLTVQGARSEAAGHYHG
jgi:hypothetical protein